MKVSRVRGLTFMVVSLVWAADAAAVTPVTACGQPLTRRGETYALTVDLTASGDCLVVGADGVTVDLKGHVITGPGDGTGIGVRDDGVARATVTVRSSVTKPGTIRGFQYGIDLVASARSAVSNVAVLGNATTGALLGHRALVKGATASGNGWYGIEALDYAQVQDSVASANGGGGILVGQNSLLVRNRADTNVNAAFPNSYVSGITAGFRSTLTWNVVNGNAGSGLHAGPQSQVYSNRAEQNQGVGIEVGCPSTVINNYAQSNHPDYELYPATCRAGSNK